LWWHSSNSFINTFAFPICRDSEAGSANGTITSLKVDDPFYHSGLNRICYLLIKAPLDQQIQVSCSALDLNSSNSFVAVSRFSVFSIFPVAIHDKVFLLDFWIE
jgi:hypothetical protein